MKLRLFSTIVMVGVILGFMSTNRGAGMPPDGNATQPAVTSLHGQVKIGANLDFAGVDLSRVVVYLESDAVLDAAPLPQTRATVAQQNKAFVPNFLVITKNTEVEFPNWDHFSHNVFSRSVAAPAFDLDRYPYGQSKMRKFDKVGVVQVFCNIHPWMKALIYVTPNRYFTRADHDGKFELRGVPAGTYQVTAWQERCQAQHQKVEVGPGLNPEISFTLEEDRDSILANDPPRHGETYGIDRGLGVKREKLNLPVVEDSHPTPTTAPCDNCP